MKMFVLNKSQVMIPIYIAFSSSDIRRLIELYYIFVILSQKKEMAVRMYKY